MALSPGTPGNSATVSMTPRMAILLYVQHMSGRHPTVIGITIVYVGVASALDSGDADPMVKIVIEEGNK